MAIDINYVQVSEVEINSKIQEIENNLSFLENEADGNQNFISFIGKLRSFYQTINQSINNTTQDSFSSYTDLPSPPFIQGSQPTTEEVEAYKKFLKYFYMSIYNQYVIQPIKDNFYFKDNELVRETKNLIMSLNSFLINSNLKYINEDGTKENLMNETLEDNIYLNNIMEVIFDVYGIKKILSTKENNYFYLGVNIWQLTDSNFFIFTSIKELIDANKNIYKSNKILELSNYINSLTTNVGFSLMFNDDNRTMEISISKTEIANQIYNERKIKNLIQKHNLNIPIYPKS